MLKYSQYWKQISRSFFSVPNNSTKFLFQKNNLTSAATSTTNAAEPTEKKPTEEPITEEAILAETPPTEQQQQQQSTSSSIPPLHVGKASGGTEEVSTETILKVVEKHLASGVTLEDSDPSFTRDSKGHLVIRPVEPAKPWHLREATSSSSSSSSTTTTATSSTSSTASALARDSATSLTSSAFESETTAKLQEEAEEPLQSIPETAVQKPDHRSTKTAAKKLKEEKSDTSDREVPTIGL